jgi:hypothetical protein
MLWVIEEEKLPWLQVLDCDGGIELSGGELFPNAKAILK